MKLHLPHALRAAVLACVMSVVAPVPMLMSGALMGGLVTFTIANGSMADAATITVSGVAIPQWTDGSTIDGQTFANGDTVVFESGDSVATLGGSVQAKLTIEEGGMLTLGDSAYAFAADTTINNSGTLVLRDTDVLGKAVLTKSYTGARVVIDWGNAATADLAAALKDHYQGNLYISQSAYTLSADTLGGQQTLFVLGGSSDADKSILTLSNGTYQPDIQFSGLTTLNVASGQTARITGQISGEGTLEKTGAGIVTIESMGALHDGTLHIKEGTVTWGLNNTTTTQYQINTMGFASIIIESGATLRDGHWGVSMSGQTDVYSNGGTMEAYDMRQYATPSVYPVAQGLTENYYKSLHVNSTATTTLTGSWKYARRFALLTSDEDKGVTLALGSANERAYTTFDTIQDFDGTINAGALSASRRLVIGTVDQADGYALTIQTTSATAENGAVESVVFEKTGEGTLTVTGSLHAQESLSMEAGTLTVSGALSGCDTADFSGGTSTVGSADVRSLTLSGATTALTVTGATEVAHTLSARNGATLTLQGTLTAHDVKVLGASVTIQGAANVTESMNVAQSSSGTAATVNMQSRLTLGGDLTIGAGGTLTVAKNLTTGDLTVGKGGTLTVTDGLTADGLLSTVGGGNLTVKGTSVQAHSFALGAGTLTATDAVLSVDKYLVMNYDAVGSYAVKGVSLSDNIVLAYNDGAQLLDITDIDMADIACLNLDLSGLSLATLKNGIDTGISAAFSESNIHIAALNSDEYTLTRTGETWQLTVSNSVTSLHETWDKNWGNEVLARGASDETLTANRIEIAASPLGLQDDPLLNENGAIVATLVGSNTTPDTPRKNNVYGAAYSTGRSDAVGKDYDLDIWMDLASGSLNMVAGGSYTESFNDQSTTGIPTGTNNLIGDVHLQAESGLSSVSSLAGGNVFTRNTTSLTGDSYISVFTSQVNDSVVASNILAGSGCTTATQTGDTHLYIYKALSLDASENESAYATVVQDFNAGDAIAGTEYTFCSNVITGGNLALAGSASLLTGDAEITFDGVNGTTSKIVSGGNYGYRIGAHTQTLDGDSMLTFCNVSDAAKFAYLVSAGNGITLPTAAETQAQSGDSSVVASGCSGSLSFSGVIAGHQICENASVGTTQTQDGSGSISLQTEVNLGVIQPDSRMGTSPITVSAVGGHFLYDAVDHTPTTHTAVQTREGSSSVSIGTTSARSTSAGAIVGSHSVHSECSVLNIQQTQNDDSTVQVVNTTITSGSLGVVGGAAVTGDSGTVQQTINGSTYVTLTNDSIVSGGVSIVGAHAVADEASSSQQTLNGSTYVTLTDVTARSTGTDTPAVVGGHAAAGGTSSIYGDTNITIKGGTFGDTVVGSTYNATNAYTYDVLMDINGATLNGDVSLIGGYASVSAGSLNDISITLANSIVNGTIYGGSDGGTIRQNNIDIDIVSGTYNGNIFAGGANGPTTGNTTITIHSAAAINSDVVSGGYDNGGATMVTGSRTVRFVDSASRSYSSTFTFFNNIDVVDSGCTISLNNSLQLANDVVTKTGMGTLYLTNVNNTINTLDIQEGCVKFAANSKKRTVIENLYVRSGATVDLSSSGVAVNGALTLCSDSTVKLITGSGVSSVPSVESLIWGNDGGNHIVTLDLGDVSALSDESGYYTVELFTGLDRESVSGLDLTECVVLGESRLATRAEKYVAMADGSSAQGGYLWLRDDGTLVLTNLMSPASYWTGEEAGTPDGNWNYSDIHWSRTDDSDVAQMVFEEGSAAYFTKDGSALDPSQITLTEDISAGQVNISGDGAGKGVYEFNLNGNTLTIRNYLTADNGAQATFNGDTLKLTAGKTVVQVNENATLEINNDISFAKLASDGTGTTTVNGDVTMSEGSSNAGNLVAQDVALGGDTAFTSLQAQAVTGNIGNTIKVTGDSSMASLDGGSLTVADGTTSIGADTSLTALAGAGTLSMPTAALTLAQNSSIGNLTADAVTLNSGLAVKGTLATDAVTFTTVNSLSSSGLLTAKKIDAGTSTATELTIDDSAVSHLFLPQGKVYKLVDSNAGSSTLLINGAETATLSNNHYSFLFKAYNDQSSANAGDVTVTATVSNPEYFANTMHEYNAKAGGALMDNLLANSNAFDNGQNEKLKALVETVDNILLTGGDADKEGASTAGSSLATLGMAFADDMERQLKAIRNRTTFMGVDPSVENEGMPYYNAWVNAEGNIHQLSNDNLYTGYKLNNYGATVGFDVDCTPHTTCGLALTAMFGDFTSDDADKLDGDFDTQYITAFARYNRRAWMHTFVASVGRADVSATRSYSVGGQEFSQDVDTDGMSFGAMYEVGRIFRLNEEGSAIIEPMVNFMFTHSSISGFDESGSEAALKVDDITMNTFTIGAGARTQAVVGENIYNRSSIFEARALVKAYAGDRQGEADVAYCAAKDYSTKVKSAEAGAVGAEIGAGLIVPLGAEKSSIFIDASLEVRADYVNGNATVGYRLEF